MTPLNVLDENGVNCKFTAGYERLLELAAARQIWGSVRGSRLRYVGLTVALSEVTPTSIRRQRSVADATAQDNRTVVRGHDITALHYEHHRRICATYAPLARHLTAGHAGELPQRLRSLDAQPKPVRAHIRASLAATEQRERPTAR